MSNQYPSIPKLNIEHRIQIELKFFLIPSRTTPTSSFRTIIVIIRKIEETKMSG